MDINEQIAAHLFGARLPQAGLLREAKALAGAIPVIAQALVANGKKKIRLVRQGNSGSTNGTVITIADTPVPVHQSDVPGFIRFVALQLGLVHHEVGHVNHTDFKAKRSADRLTQFIENVIEDVRQENQHIVAHRNGRAVLDALGLIMDLDLTEQDEVDRLFGTPDPVTVFVQWLFRTLRWKYRGQGYLADIAARARLRLAAILGEPAVQALEGLAARTADLANTADAIALAADLVAELRKQLQAAQEAQQEAQQGDQGDQDAEEAQQGDRGDQDAEEAQQGDQGNQDAEEAQQGDRGNQDAEEAQQGDQGNQDAEEAQQGDQGDQGTAGNPGDSQGTAGNQGDSQGTAGNQGDSQGSQASASQQDAPSPQAIAQAIAEMLAGENLKGSGDRTEQVQAAIEQLSEELRDNGAVMAWFDPNATTANDPATWVAKSQSPDHGFDVEAALPQVGRIRAVLNRHLQVLSASKTGRSTRGHKLAPKALVRIPMGDARLFQAYQAAILTDTAIVIAVDRSGSMTGDQMHLASQAAFAAVCAIETLPKCQVACIAFPDRVCVKPFGVRARKHRDAFRLSADGGTPMAEAVIMATAMLRTRREPRKLLLVVTDGQPDNFASTVLALAAAQRAGIEAMAIGIRMDVSPSLFATSVRVDTPDALPGAMLTMLGGRLGRQVA